MPPSFVHHLILFSNFNDVHPHWVKRFMQSNCTDVSCCVVRACHVGLTTTTFLTYATPIKTYEMPTPGPKMIPFLCNPPLRHQNSMFFCDAFPFTWDPANQAWICFTFFNWFCTALASPPAERITPSNDIATFGDSSKSCMCRLNVLHVFPKASTLNAEGYWMKFLMNFPQQWTLSVK